MRRLASGASDREEHMKTYVFRIVVEPDEDRWVAFAPALKARGGAIWGYTQDEALENIRQVVQMTIQSMREHGEPIPQDPASDVLVLPEPQVAVTV